jgi:hypothetical protein
MNCQSKLVACDGYNIGYGEEDISLANVKPKKAAPIKKPEAIAFR